MSRKFPEALTAPIRYRTLSLSDRGHATLRVTFPVLRHRGSTKAVVATDPTSADADYDNGAALRSMCGRRWSYDRAVQRVGSGGHVPR